jgi:hypothetical protein
MNSANNNYVEDWRNQQLKVGDLIVYPTRFSSTMDMNEAKVLEILWESHPWKEYVKIARPALILIFTTFAVY